MQSEWAKGKKGKKKGGNAYRVGDTAKNDRMLITFWIWTDLQTKNYRFMLFGIWKEDTKHKIQSLTL